MDRARLEDLTLEQLQAEAAKYGLPTTGSWENLLDAIMDHLQKFGPADDLFRGAAGPATANGATKKTSKVVQPRRESQESADVLRQMLTAMQQQQQQMGQIYQLLLEQRAERPEPQQQLNVAGPAPTNTPPRASPSEEVGRR